MKIKKNMEERLYLSITGVKRKILARNTKVCRGIEIALYVIK